MAQAQSDEGGQTETGTRASGSAASVTTNVVALAGGVGGAKLAAGLQAVLPSSSLSVVINTGDDFKLWGLHISPDIDTVMYTLAGIANSVTGWGLADETWTALDMISKYGRDAWFKVGDKDFATHILRTQMLAEGHTLTEVTHNLASALGIGPRLLPMSNQSVETLIETPDGTLDFQDYFVRRRHDDTVTGVIFKGAENAQPTAEVRQALSQATAIIFCPSNPIVSVGPILAVPELQPMLERTAAPRVAVSPIVGGTAIKGPAAAMLQSLGHEVSPLGVAKLYIGLIDGIVIDKADSALEKTIKEQTGIEVYIANTIMNTQEDKTRLAGEVLRFCETLGQGAAR